VKKFLITVALTFLAACNSLQKPSDLAPAFSDEQKSTLLLYAMSLVDTPYRYGGNNTESGFDCSGFVVHVYKEALNIALPRTSVGISKAGKVINSDAMQAGDLVFFNTQHSAYSHVGIYIGEERFIHSPKAGSRIRIDNMTEYWLSRYNGARRIY